MSQNIDLQGQCLCGSIRIKAESVKNSVGACHCKSCRRWGGGPFMEVDCGQAVTISGEEHLSVFNSSEWAERGFCRQCGAHLFYRIKESGQHMIPVGLFDDGVDLVFESQVFIDEKPSYYHFANETQDLTGAELFAKFGAPD
ncbi:MAG: GFA family protein [Woeseia sp.]|nr:GFA family protein [Woeseia sp.]MBT8097466.1 GFA family protein [Woeseia sp.]NNE60904.1 GFA family protein [Woeseia sp.]NNL53938.1 GFA family protein [Woeseia sp.]